MLGVGNGRENKIPTLQVSGCAGALQGNGENGSIRDNKDKG